MPHRATWGCPWEQSEKTGAVEGKLCSIKSVWSPLHLVGG